MDHVRAVGTANRAAAGGHHSVAPYQTTHDAGGAAIGTDPATSVVNRYSEMWDHHDVFVFGACPFAQNLGDDPTGPLMGPAYWTLDHVKNDCPENPRPLMGA